MSSLLSLVSASGMLDLALKSAAVMLLAVVVAALLSRSSAAWRHLVWCLAVVNLLFLPAFSLALPAWNVAWLPAWTAEPVQPEAAPQTDLAKAAPAALLEDVWLDDQPPPGALSPAADSSESEDAVSLGEGGPALASSLVPPYKNSPHWSVPATTRLAIAWGAGALLSLLPLAVGLAQLAELNRRSRVIEENRWLTLLDELRRQLGVRRGVRLRECEAALAPLTWGALRPVLLVPAEAEAWPDARRRLVLLHELAHVRRWDWLTQLVAHVACAMYWFNPLVWLAARQMRIERERACDDLVLASGARASDYAQELLALAAGLSNSRLSALVAVPMARRGALEDRLRRILDGRRRRAALTTAAVCLGAALAAAATLPLAMLRAAPPQPAAPRADESRSEAAKPQAAKPSTDKPVEKPVEKAEKPIGKALEDWGKRQVTIRGKVVDDATMEPIAAFIINGGKIDPANPKSVIWGGRIGPAGITDVPSSAADGSFSTIVGGAEGSTARILADGYIPQPLLAAAVPADKDELEMTVRLARVPERVRGVVLDHTGKPLKDAAVFAVGPNDGLNLVGGEARPLSLSSPPLKNPPRPVRTDAEGRFELATSGASSVGISHVTFDRWHAVIPKIGDMTIRLPEPARLEIKLDIEGAEKESVVMYQFLSHLDLAYGIVVSTRAVSIANPGKLTLAAMPPGKYQYWRGSGRMQDREFFELKPGETKKIDHVRAAGARVRGKVTWPADAKLASIHVVITTNDAEARVYSAVQVSEDGTFLTERIPPGSQHLAAYAYKVESLEEAVLSGLRVPRYFAQMSIEVPLEGEVKVDVELKTGGPGK